MGAKTLSQILYGNHAIVGAIIDNNKSHIDPLNIIDPIMLLITKAAQSPEKALDYQKKYMVGLLELLQLQDDQNKIRHAANDNTYNQIAEISQYHANFFMSLLQKESSILNQSDARRLNFFARLLMSSTGPANTALSSNAIAKEFIATRGCSATRGLQYLLTDIAKGNITTANTKAFSLGINIAATKGSVVFKNHLFELIHYAPTTKCTYNAPLLIIPPWINKYYVLDLSQENSFVRWLIDKQRDVYIISWVNPGPRMRNTTFEDYLVHGALKAYEYIRHRRSHVQLMGYCLGGTLTSILLAYLTAKGEARHIPSATFLASLIDFGDVGDFVSLISDTQTEAFKQRVRAKGYVPGAELYQLFSLMRAEDMIWRNTVERYCLGRTTPNNDLLYWNYDPTNLPAEMSVYYIENLYRDNKLIQPNALVLGGIPIDLSIIKTPSFFLATEKDHIVPWKSAYKGARIWPNSAFVLSGSGHIAGVINPPTQNKYGFWTSDSVANNPEMWLAGAQRHSGSWWNKWLDWNKSFAGNLTRPIHDPRKLYPAPGKYVTKRVMK